MIESVSFTGCGFLCIYHVGVSAALRLFVPDKVRQEWSLYGSSSGALAAAVLLCEKSEMGEAVRILLENAKQARNVLRSPRRALNFGLSLRNGLEQILGGDAHLRCSDRLFISLTRVRDWKNVVVSQFSTREELIQAIMCSCHIFGLFGWIPPTFRGEYYVDGAFSDNQPICLHQEGSSRTITVNPFEGESDICPRDKDSASFLNVTLNGTSVRLTATNIHRSFGILFPPSVSASKKLYSLGFSDALRYLRGHTNICPNILHPHLKEFSAITKKRKAKAREKQEEEALVLYPVEVHKIFEKYMVIG